MSLAVRRVVPLGILFFLAGCVGTPIAKVAPTEPEADFVRVKSLAQVQAEQSEAQRLRLEHLAALQAVVPASQPASQPATQPTTQPAPEPATQPAVIETPIIPGDPAVP